MNALLKEICTILKLNLAPEEKYDLIKRRINEVCYGLKHGIDPNKRIPFKVNR